MKPYNVCENLFLSISYEVLINICRQLALRQ